MDACRLFGRIIGRALLGRSKDEVALGDAEAFAGAATIVAITRGDYRGKRAEDVRGTGYVVQSLEAALWCFMETESFEAAVLQAANLGDDADTTATVCGQVAGAFYGESALPPRWRERLAHAATITQLADRLAARLGDEARR